MITGLEHNNKNLLPNEIINNIHKIKKGKGNNNRRKLRTLKTVYKCLE